MHCLQSVSLCPLSFLSWPNTFCLERRTLDSEKDCDETRRFVLVRCRLIDRRFCERARLGLNTRQTKRTASNLILAIPSGYLPLCSNILTRIVFRQCKKSQLSAKKPKNHLRHYCLETFNSTTSFPRPSLSLPRGRKREDMGTRLVLDLATESPHRIVLLMTFWETYKLALKGQCHITINGSL